MREFCVVVTESVFKVYKFKADSWVEFEKDQDCNTISVKFHMSVLMACSPGF